MKLTTSSQSLALAGIALAALCRLHAQTVSDETVLFAFDDHAIPFSHNLQLTMEAAEKYAGNPVLGLGPMGSTDEWQMNYYGTVLKIGDKYRMWYIAESKDGFVNGISSKDFVPSGSRFAYAESTDGIHWTKTDLGLMKFRSSKHNNLIGMPEGLYGYHSLVRYEPEERDASRRYKMMALLWSSGAYTIPALDKVGLVFVPFYSADGLSWRIADELLPNGGQTLSDKFHLISGVEGSGLYKWKGMYYLTGQSWGREGHASIAPYGRHVEIFHSPDLLHWSETQTMGFARQGEFRPPHRPDGKPPMPEDRDDPAYDNEQTHEGASVWVRGNVALGLTGFWHGSNDWHKITHDLGFIISNDGLHFREPQPDFIFARVGERGRDWDYAGISQGQGFENVGDKTYIWYGGPMDQSEGPRSGTPFLRHGGVGLLILDRDRFGSLSTRDPAVDGSFVTNTFEVKPGQKVWVNATGLGDDSRLRLEVLDPTERPLAGAPAEAVLTESGLHVPVAWPGGASLPSGGIKLKATFEGAERNGIQFYAIYLGP